MNRESNLGTYTICKDIVGGMHCTTHYQPWVWWLTGVIAVGILAAGYWTVRNER